jgi:hypothetical protein
VGIGWCGGKSPRSSNTLSVSFHELAEVLTEAFKETRRLTSSSFGTVLQQGTSCKVTQLGWPGDLRSTAVARSETVLQQGTSCKVTQIEWSGDVRSTAELEKRVLSNFVTIPVGTVLLIGFIAVDMIPDFNEDGQLPSGIHLASMEEIAARFGREPELRRAQLDSLRWLVDLAKRVGVQRLIVNGSFVTDKWEPNDVDLRLDERAVVSRGRVRRRRVMGGAPFRADSAGRTKGF